MKYALRNIFLITLLALGDVTSLKAQYSVNYDYQTIAAMVSGYATQAGTEVLHQNNVSKIADAYSYSEVATAGIYASKLLDRNALKSSTGFGDPDENYYYRKIYRLVANKIIPRTVRVTEKLVRDPSTALFWGSHLVKAMADTKSLCNQFCAVCTNSTLNFDDINFLEFAGTLQSVFNLQNYTDYIALFENLADIGQNFSTENIESEFDNLQNMAVGLANAGASDVRNLFKRSAFDGTFVDNVGKIIDMADRYSTMWNTLETSAASTLNELTSGDIKDISHLFTASNSGSSSWISAYTTNSNSSYYKQRVYISEVGPDSETLCSYRPPVDMESYSKSDHYYRVATDRELYDLLKTEGNAALMNSYNHAGWSKSMVDQKNASNDGYTYSMVVSSNVSNCNYNGHYGFAVAYSITVTRKRNQNQVYYEDTFDSYSVDWNTFMNVMQARLTDANRNGQGKTYQIGFDDKIYYTASNERKLKGATLANFVTRCESKGTIVDGNLQYKCDKCGKNPDEHTKQCSMSTSLQSNGFSFAEINKAISDTEEQISLLQGKITDLNNRNRDILRELGSLSISTDEYKELQAEYQANKERIKALEDEASALVTNLEGYRKSKQEAIEFENNQTDGENRIPSIMHELQTNFSLEWVDEGHWEGYTFVRKATMGGLKTILTFRATVSISRAPKYFLGIKIHRAIVKISYGLTAEYSDSQIIETMQLDPTMDAKEQNEKVNQRLSELQKDYPDCAVSVDFEYSPGLEPDTADDDNIHLLWASDRLDVAREVCHRLEAIYVDLVVLDKFLSYKYSILDWLKDATINRLQTDRGKRQTIADRCRKRWLHNGGSLLYIKEDEDDYYEEE